MLLDTQGFGELSTEWPPSKNFHCPLMITSVLFFQKCSFGHRCTFVKLCQAGRDVELLVHDKHEARKRERVHEGVHGAYKRGREGLRLEQ